MAKLIRGNRIGREARLRPGASAVIFDPTRQSILLTRRTDNGRWCLPGGGMDPGESAEETCVREVLEETGLEVQVKKLIGVYTSPDIVIEYADGERIQAISFCFEAEVTGGELRLSEETLDYRYVTVGELSTVDVMENHLRRIEDACQHQIATFIR